ncbi:hypothetical protein D3C87_1408970 [compost metagenome]
MAIIAGTAQAKPERIGTKERPLIPRAENGRSIKVAARARYPDPSKRPIPKNKIKICGTKTNTAPKLETIPFAKKSAHKVPGPIAATSSFKLVNQPSI